jgi:hypothetical protein
VGCGWRRVAHAAPDERDHEQDDDATHGRSMLRRVPSRVKRPAHRLA